ncbi:TonB-dependent receptor domain-containing protein [Sphingobacterium sp. Mn56C]|uniref:TonB-dependent receptor n=1 Tax=Sphingobacterium sp. Mn56C TaxID=3395261 RepID=UPI003BCF0AE6
MKINLTIKSASLLLFGIILNLAVYAQQGSGIIVGSVKNEENTEPLVGVSIRIIENAKKLSTNVSGNYTFTGLASGSYTLEFSYLGFAKKQIAEVEVVSGKVTTLNVVLSKADGEQLDEVVIRGSYKKESIHALYAQQKNSIAISDGISAEIIKKSPDRNTGEVLKRISGASVQDDRFIIVRGLSDRYNTALINNSPLPSTEPDRKSFSFDIIPASLIDNIVVSKTATADLPGDFSGGAIQVKTKDFPDQKTFEVSIGAGYNSISTFKDFYGSKRVGQSYFGFVNPANKLPNSFPSSAAVYSDYDVADKVAVTKQFANTWGVSRLGKAMPSQNFNIVYGNSYTLKNTAKLGFIASLNYRNSETIQNQLRNDFNSIDRVTGPGPQYFTYKDDYFTFASNVGALANVTYIKQNFKLSWKNIFNQIYEDSYIRREGEFDLQYYRKSSQQEINQKRMFNSVLEGDHAFEKLWNSKLNWNLSFSRFTNDQPDLRRLTYSKRLEDMSDPSIPFEANVTQSPTSSSAGRFYSDLKENIYAAGVNYAVPVRLLNQDQTLKIGVTKQYKERNVDARVLGYALRSDDVNESNRIRRLSQEELFDPSNIARNTLYIEDITNPTNKYKGSGDLNAGYVMLTGKVTDQFKATVGARVENYLEKLTAGSYAVDNNYVDFLPSLNLTYELTAKTNVRASFSRTVARAQFRELAPFSFFNFITETMDIGNPDLKRTQISNFDLRYEIYPSAGMLFTVSAFYKKLDNAIEKAIQAGSTGVSKTISYINAPQASIYGAELELRQDFGFINPDSRTLKNLIFNANVAVIKSEVDLSKADDKVKSVNEIKRPLQGQSPYLINAGLQYSSPWDLDFNLMYNRIGRRIDIVGFGGYTDNSYTDYFAEYPNIYEAPRDLFDAQVSKRFLRKKLEVKVSASNILDSKRLFYQDINDNKKYDKDDHLINSVRFGRNFSVSLGYRF